MKHLALAAVIVLYLSTGLSAQAIDTSAYQNDLNEAEKLFTQGDLDGAIRKLTPWIEKNAALREAQHGIGLAYYQKQDFAGAIRHLTAAIKLETENSAAWKQTVEILAMAYYFSNRAQDARPLLERALTWSAGNANLLYSLAMTYLYTHDRDNCRRAFARLFQVPPESPQAFVLAADLMIQENYAADGEALILQAQKKRPDLPEANYKLGVIALNKGAFPAAIEYLEKELATNPGHAMAWHYLGDAYIRLGKFEQAIDPLQRSIWLNLQATRSYILLANVYAQQERYFVAENALKRALDMAPQNYEAHFQLARIYHKTNRPELAKQEMAIAESLRTSNNQKFIPKSTQNP